MPAVRTRTSKILGPDGRPLVLPARPVERRAVHGSYDAAKTNDDNRRHWAGADALSARFANSPGVRRLLRDRARYEIANNTYAKGIVETLANDIIGTGPRLQLLTASPEANRKIERSFAQWCKWVGLAAKLRTMVKAKKGDGEGFAVFVNNPALPTQVQLDLELFEGDQFTTPNLSVVTMPTAVDGIIFDAVGNPVEYHLLDHHPGDMLFSNTTHYNRIPASAVLHWFRTDRPGQRRGVPEITAALPLFAQLRRYTLAVIAAAETAADFAAVLQAAAPADSSDDAVAGDPFDEVEIVKRMMLTLPEGWEMSQFKAEQPTTTYPQFKSEILNEIARCLNVPYNVAAGNSRDYNYASGRLDHQVYHRSIDVERDNLELVLLERILLAWLDEAALIDGFLPDGLGPFLDWPHQWFWPGFEHVDPLKEANAQAVRLLNHTTTLAAEYARQGQDWEEAVRQRAKEVELMKSLGLALVGGPATEVMDPNDPEAVR